MDSKYFFQKLLGPGIRNGTVGVLLFFAFSMLGGRAYAQKKGKNDDDVNQARQDSIEYVNKLNLFWSFGYENYKNKQYADAIKHFWKVAEMDTIGKFPKVYQFMGQSYFEEGKIDSAEFVYEMGIEKYPDEAHLHRMLGWILSQKEQVDDAINQYQAVVKLDPESKSDWKQLANLYVKADRLDDAINAYDHVLKIDPNDAEARERQSALLGATGDIEGAVAKKEEALQQDPNNVNLLFELGKDYFEKLEDYDKAAEKFRKLVHLRPDDINAWEYLGESYQRLEKYSDAIDAFKKVVEKEPDNKKAFVEISRSYRGLNNFSAARTYARKALAIDNRYGLAWIALGEAYEASAERCVNKKSGKIDFNDKLVYELAYTQYKKAANDLEFKSEAERKMGYLQPVLPTTEDKFMNKGQDKPKGDCYGWIY